MRMRNLVLAAGAATLVAAPAALSHPTTITYIAKSAYSGGTFTNQVRYVVMEHGYVTVLRESNSVRDHGVLNLANLPSAYRSTLATKADWFTAMASMSHPINVADTGATPVTGVTMGNLTGAADTGAQAHATCQGVTALTSGNATGNANVTGWQASHSGGDPFFNYVPWQGTASGLDDINEIDDWLAVDNAVLAQAGQSLRVSASSSVADFTAACAALGGTYASADATQTSIASASSGSIADAQAPLSAQITDLTTQVSSLQEQLAQKTADLAASLARMSPFSIAFASPRVTRASVQADGIHVTVSGPTGRTASVVVRVREKVAERLRLPVVLGVAAGAPGPDGTVQLRVVPGKGAMRRLLAADGSVPVIGEVLPFEAPGTATGQIVG